MRELLSPVFMNPPLLKIRVMLFEKQRQEREERREEREREIVRLFILSTNGLMS